MLPLMLACLLLALVAQGVVATFTVATTFAPSYVLLSLDFSTFSVFHSSATGICGDYYSMQGIVDSSLFFPTVPFTDSYVSSQLQSYFLSGTLTDFVIGRAVINGPSVWNVLTPTESGSPTPQACPYFELQTLGGPYSYQYWPCTTVLPYNYVLCAEAVRADVSGTTTTTTYFSPVISSVNTTTTTTSTDLLEIDVTGVTTATSTEVLTSTRTLQTTSTITVTRSSIQSSVKTSRTTVTSFAVTTESTTVATTTTTTTTAVASVTVVSTEQTTDTVLTCPSVAPSTATL